jgi:hypothetical protein
VGEAIYRFFVGLAVALLALPNPAYAAKLLPLPAGSDCTFELQGDIGPNDDQLFGGQFWKELGRAIKADSKPATLCLDSNGGSWAAGLKIAHIILDDSHGLSLKTYVMAGKQCLSACAIIFMAGTEPGADSNFLSRTIVAGGELGFHAPYLEMAKGNYTAGEVDLAYSVASVQISDLVRFSMRIYGGQVVFPDILLEASLATPKNQLVRLDTVMAAILAQVNVQFPESLVHEHKTDYQISCDNFIASRLVIDANFNTAGWSGSLGVFKSVSESKNTCLRRA